MIGLAVQVVLSSSHRSGLASSSAWRRPPAIRARAEKPGERHSQQARADREGSAIRRSLYSATPPRSRRRRTGRVVGWGARPEDGVAFPTHRDTARAFPRKRSRSSGGTEHGSCTALKRRFSTSLTGDTEAWRQICQDTLGPRWRGWLSSHGASRSSSAMTGSGGSPSGRNVRGR
jgi:hypothetical protein